MFRKQSLVLLILLSLYLAACSGAPKQIATYPQEKPVAAAGYPAGGSYVYDAYLELEVRRPESTAERAIDLTQDYGGYLADSQSWWVDGEQQVSLSLSVPAVNFDQLYSALQRLGTVTSEHVYGRWDGSGDGWRITSQITLLLRDSSPRWPRLSLGDWHLLDTLQQAWHVSTSLFGFLLDVLIWALVVVGPFVLIGLGVRKLYLKLKP
jgi:hypothetical protein